VRIEIIITDLTPLLLLLYLPLFNLTLLNIALILPLLQLMILILCGPILLPCT
jgi:hypothetical protein